MAMDPFGLSSFPPLDLFPSGLQSGIRFQENSGVHYPLRFVQFGITFNLPRLLETRIYRPSESSQWLRCGKSPPEALVLGSGVHKIGY
jgi:hypothetical protein